MQYDAIVVGAGPAGLSAGIELAQAEYRVLLLEKESLGGPILNVEWINDYPEAGRSTAGAMVATDLVERAKQLGIETELAEVSEVEQYSSCMSVGCSDGRAYTASVVVLAGGLQPTKLGIPGEEDFMGKGLIHCAMCDAGLYRDRVVAVCGGGDAALTEALYLARFASKVFVIERNATLAAKEALQTMALTHPKVEIRFSEMPVEIKGDDGVSELVVEGTSTGVRKALPVYGVLGRIGFAPNTKYLEGLVSLDEHGRVMVNEHLATDVPGTFAAGDMRTNSPRQVWSAVADGKIAAQSAIKALADIAR